MDDLEKLTTDELLDVPRFGKGTRTNVMLRSGALGEIRRRLKRLEMIEASLRAINRAARSTLEE